MTIKPIPTLYTPRLKMRPFSLEDTPLLYNILQQREIFKFFPQTENPPLVRVEKIIKVQLRQYEEYGYGTWAVETRNEPNLIGWCGLNYLPETDEEEVAYLFSQAHQGQGYATESAKLSLEYGFQEMGMKRIICLMHPENIASRKVAEKIGMKFLDRKNYWGLELLRYEKFREEEDVP
jgi:ribosomal-protein-alanine N-acetyltransferase